MKMSEQITSPYTTEPAEKSGDDQPHRWRFQFSLRSLLLFFLFFALLLTSIVMYWRLSQSEKEVKKIRDIAGYLKIEDENLFYALALESHEPWTWRWRVYLPAGYKYSWNIAVYNIRASGFPSDNCCSTDGSPRKKETEAIVILSLRKDPENKWILNLQNQATDAKGGIAIPISDQIANQFMTSSMSDTQCVGSIKAESHKLDEPIVFLRYRIGEKQPDGSWKITEKDAPGIMVWLQAVP
jgi:hypothetical protein